jgi:gluconokinase
MKTVRFYIIMGVAGSGKSSVGKVLAEHLKWDFYDADDFHPPENVSKMATGTPLTDADRAPWLAALHDLISSNLKQGKPSVLACSALKENYRAQLMKDNHGVRLVYLKGDYDLLMSRLNSRSDHFMKPQMLQSQFATLEEPADALTIELSSKSVEDIVQEILKSI